MRIDRVDTVRRAFQAICRADTSAALEILRGEYPFAPIISQTRRYTENQSLNVFKRDGFIDRYSGQRLLFPGILRLLSQLLPQEFPFHPNWKMSETHPAYWELFPTIDHIVPVSRGGSDTEGNWVTTSMIRNAAKASWTLEELDWIVYPAGSLAEWDGLTSLFVDYAESDKSILRDAYLRRWYNASVRKVANTE